MTVRARAVKLIFRLIRGDIDGFSILIYAVITLLFLRDMVSRCMAGFGNDFFFNFPENRG